MCGLSGFWNAGGFNVLEAKHIAQKMAMTIAHRGPDDSGVWVDGGAGIALAHRRLAILDLSSAGHQPMESATGRFVVAFNGEIYNHIDLREEIGSTRQRQSWRGWSDTETLLAGIEIWGLTETLRKTVGMFSIALWDRKQRTLTFARDRMGEKPLYYGSQKGVLLFGSELKAFKAHPSFSGEVDPGALSLLFRHGHISAPYSIFKHIKKLLPSTILTFRHPTDDPIPELYWSLKATEEERSAPFDGSPMNAADQLEELLRGAIRQQMVADVPLGAFLSGGIDSSVVVALMQAQSAQKVRTFAIGFEEGGHDEAPHALAVARHLGTEHTELYVTSREARDLVPTISSIYSEPFADSSQIPTYFVSALARRQVTVSLSGDGGDELFCGYDRYLSFRKWCARMASVPKVLRGPLAHAARLAGTIDQSRRESWERLDDLLRASTQHLLYRQLTSHWRHPSDLVIGGSELPTVFSNSITNASNVDPIDMAMTLDLASYLPDDILCKVDRAAMAVSLETRMPFLNHHVIEFACNLPLKYKLQGGVTKSVLRDILKRYLPASYFDRPKMGFGVPIGEWLRGDLRDWASDLLSESRLQQQGYFDPEPVIKKWQDHQAGRQHWESQLWPVLMFEAWRDSF